MSNTQTLRTLQLPSELEPRPERKSTSLKHYLAIARFDHWFKNFLMLPGFALAVVLGDVRDHTLLFDLIIGLLSAGLIASANYTINEWLDREFDRHHPIKHARPSASGYLSAGPVYTQWAIFAAAGLGLAWFLSMQFFSFALLLLIMGIAYNVKPLRTKDRQYVDVLSESINSPLRLGMGWAIALPGALAPSSMALSYWMGGAFLMAVKRYAEYRLIDDPERAALYRRSFASYTEKSLLLSSFFYALMSAFFLGVFLVKYRIEFLITLPLFATLFVWYLAIGMRTESVAQNPEKLYRERRFLVFIALLCMTVTFATLVEMPWLEFLIVKLEFNA